MCRVSLHGRTVRDIYPFAVRDFLKGINAYAVTLILSHTVCREISFGIFCYYIDFLVISTFVSDIGKPFILRIAVQTGIAAADIPETVTVCDRLIRLFFG